MAYVDIAGHQTWHEVTGDGPPVLLLHGGFSGASAFIAQTPAIAQAGYRVHVPERRGHAHTPDIEGPLTYSVMADDTIAYLEAQVRGPAALIGWSDGAVVALLVAQRRPELVDRMVLIGQYYNSAGRAPDDQIEALLASLETSNFLRASYDPYSPDGPEHFPVVYAKTMEMIRTEPEIDLAALADVHVPTLVLQGDRDLVTVEHSAAVVAALPDARLAVLPGTHGLPVESPDTVNPLLLGFLRQGTAVQSFMPRMPDVRPSAGVFDKGAAMSMTSADPGSWTVVDEGWGRRAVDFSTLSEPSNCREYVALHHLLDVAGGDRLLDVACGSGLAIELARLRGALCAGIDASARLVAVARSRSPDCDIRIGDMHHLPWEDDAFDVVTSFRGIWGTTPAAVSEVYRVLRPAGRVGLTVWGHLKVSPGAWALSPLRLASQDKVANQATMVSLGRPGAGERLLEACGFLDIRRVEVPFAWEFADPETFARALASSGPAYEAIQNVGEQAFHDAAVDQAREHMRDGLPLRAQINVVGYLARKPEEDLQP